MRLVDVRHRAQLRARSVGHAHRGSSPVAVGAAEHLEAYYRRRTDTTFGAQGMVLSLDAGLGRDITKTAVTKRFDPPIPTERKVSEGGSRSFRAPPASLPQAPAYGHPAGRMGAKTARQNHDHGWGAWDSNPQPKD